MCRLQATGGKRAAFGQVTPRTAFIHACFCCVAFYKRIVCSASTLVWRNDEHDEDAGFIAEFDVKHQFAIRVSTVISTLQPDYSQQKRSPR